MNIPAFFKSIRFGFYEDYIITGRRIVSTINEFIIANNKFGSNSAGDTSIFVEYGYGIYSSSKNVICNNTGGISYYVRPGIKYLTHCNAVNVRAFKHPFKKSSSNTKQTH